MRFELGNDHHLTLPPSRGGLSMRPVLRVGPVGGDLTPRGVWSAVVDYTTLDTVSHGGGVWWAQTDPPVGAEPGVHAAWASRGTTDQAMSAIDSNPATTFRVQQDARLSVVVAAAPDASAATNVTVLNALFNSGAETVHLRPGAVYDVDAALGFHPNTHIVGNGATIRLTANNAATHRIAADAVDVTIEGVTFDANNHITSNGKFLYNLGGGSRWRVRNCRFINTGGNPAATDWQGCIHFKDGDDIIIEGNYFENCGAPIFVGQGDAADGVGATNVTIQNNYITGYEGKGIECRGGTTNPTGFRVMNNKVLYPFAGVVNAAPIYIDGKKTEGSSPTWSPNNSIDDVVVAGNTCIGNDTYIDTGDLIRMRGVRGGAVYGNTVMNGGDKGIVVSYGSRDVKVYGNTVERTDSDGIVMGFPDPAFSLAVTQAFGLVVANNTIRNVGLDRANEVTTKELTSNVATITTVGAHGETVSSSVTVARVGAPFDGTYTVTAATTNTFSYAKVNADIAPTAATGRVNETINYGIRVQNGHGYTVVGNTLVDDQATPTSDNCVRIMPDVQRLEIQGNNHYFAGTEPSSVTTYGVARDDASTGLTPTDYFIDNRYGRMRRKRRSINTSPVSALEFTQGTDFIKTETAIAETVTAKTWTLAVESNITIRARISWVKSDMVQGGAYEITGVFFRNGSANVAQRGATAKVVVIETVGTSDADFTIDTTAQTVSLALTSGSAGPCDWLVTVEWDEIVGV